MKKTVFITFLMLILNSSFMMALDIVTLEPLKENESLRLDYQKRVLNVEKISGNTTEIYYTCKSEWGAWQISSDKRKVLIYENGMISGTEIETWTNGGVNMIHTFFFVMIIKNFMT